MLSLKRMHKDLKRAAKAPVQSKLLFVQPRSKTEEVSFRDFFNLSWWNISPKYNFLSGLENPNTNNLAE